MVIGTKMAQTEMGGQPNTVSELPKGLMQPQSAAALLSTPRRQLLLQHIWQRTSLSRPQFQRFYGEPIERYAALVQQFPASESHHHAYLGGMLDHGLEIVAFGLKLRQSYLLPIGAPPELQAAQAEAWTAATAYAALLHDIGKVAVDLEVQYGNGAAWHPWHGVLSRPYRFRFDPDRKHRLHEAAAGLLYVSVLGEPILDWLCKFSELWTALLYVLASRHDQGGVLGELVARADRASVAQALGGDPGKTHANGQQSLQRQLREGLRYLVRERFKLNQPQASDGWLTQDALWLVSKTGCDKLRAHLLSHGISGVPESNSVLFDILQEHGLVQATPDGRAIWTARVISVSGWTQEFTFLKLAPALIWDNAERPAPYQGRIALAPEGTVASNPSGTVPTEIKTPRPSIHPGSNASETETAPSDPLALASVVATDSPMGDSEAELVDTSPVHTMPDSSTIEIASSAQAASDLPFSEHDATNQAHGERFLGWLRHAALMRKLIVNDAKALIHTVDGTAFIVTPRIFQRFLQEFPIIRFESRDPNQSPWIGLQKSFERLGRHRKHPNGLNIWICEVAGPRKTRHVNGYLLLDGHDIFAEIPPDNPYLRLTTATPDNNSN